MSSRSLLLSPSLLTLLALLLVFPPHIHGEIIKSCGNIKNITFPFRLQNGDGDACGDKRYSLTCENNRTVLQLYSGKYDVQSIDYDQQTIRIIDSGITQYGGNRNCTPLPLQPLSEFNFSYNDPFQVKIWNTTLALFLKCQDPVKSDLYKDGTNSNFCNKGVVDVGRNYFYVVYGDFWIYDLADMCSLETMALLSSSPSMPMFGEPNSTLSFEGVMKELGNGLELSWEFRDCKACERRMKCFHGDVSFTSACPSHCSPSAKPNLLRKYFKSIGRNILGIFVLMIVFIFLARIFCIPCVFGYIGYKFSKRHLSMFDTIEGFLRSQNNLMPIRYSYSDIKKMSNAFADKLGQGGYGSVYKGKLRSGHLVAVKVLSQPKTDGQDFINEVATIGSIHHVNVVQLIGFCAERSKRALLYEFMPNGSLEKYVFSPDGKGSLSCEKMYDISLGVARGIEYLHRGCDMQILHFDIKPHNILLDANFVPKVSDFGLAKLYPTKESVVSLTAARGTLGYMAPELFYKNIGGVSYKADVYSFGMLLMEMAGKRRNWSTSGHSSQIYFPSWVHDQFTDEKHIEIGETVEEQRLVKKMMVVALWCIQMKPDDRPSMSKVVEMLEGGSESLQIPPRPFLYPQHMLAENQEMDNQNPELPDLSGACMDGLTMDISAR